MILSLLSTRSVGVDEGHVATEHDAAFVTLLKGCHELIAAQIADLRSTVSKEVRYSSMYIAMYQLDTLATHSRNSISQRTLSISPLNFTFLMPCQPILPYPGLSYCCYFGPSSWRVLCAPRRFMVTILVKTLSPQDPSHVECGGSMCTGSDDRLCDGISKNLTGVVGKLFE